MKHFGKQTRLSLLSVMAASLTLLPGSDAHAQAAPCTIPTNTISFSAVPGTMSWADVTLQDVPAGFGITNGHYSGWCLQFNDPLEIAHAYRANLYHSLSPALPGQLAVVSWNKVNYILNHKQGTAAEVQNALWKIIGDPVEPPFTGVSQAMVDAANANGLGFVPQLNQPVAIIIEPEDFSIQRLVVEMICPQQAAGVGQIGNFVWQDANCDGQQAGEAGLSNVVVRLIEAGMDGQFGTGDDLDKGFVTTDDSGFYSFAALDLGKYRVIVDTNTLPAGFASNTGNNAATVILTFDAFVREDVDFGFCRLAPPPASIRGVVFCDYNGNGLRDAGEPVNANVLVTLIGTMMGTNVTAFDGSYSFSNLVAGAYVVATPSTMRSIVLQAGDKTNNVDLIECRMSEGACRVTGGGKQTTSQTFPAVSHVTHGGQVGAPVGLMTAFDPDSECIRGNWTHVRHGNGAEGNFHARSFDSLMCACLGCPDDPNSGIVVGGLCNPGDRECGPEPRKAPANKICFSGIGNYAVSGGKRAERSVLFRVDIEDRGEPGNSKKASEAPADRYRIRLWVLTDAEVIQLNNPADRLLAFRKAVACSPNSAAVKDGANVPNGTAVFGVRPPDVDDGGLLEGGNHQIHPAKKECK